MSNIEAVFQLYLMLVGLIGVFVAGWAMVTAGFCLRAVFKRGIEAKLSIERDVHQEGAPSGAHELADNTGEMVMIILPGLGCYEASESEKPTAQEDQPDLLNSASDDLYDEAVAFATENGTISISALQRELKVGYNRAARLVEIMEHAGVVGPLQNNGRREVLG